MADELVDLYAMFDKDIVTHWDPGNLLQIMDIDNPFEPLCQAPMDGYPKWCRTPLSGPPRGAVFRRIRNWSQIPPSRVTDEELRLLARVCICSHHGRELRNWEDQFVERWKPVIAKAAKHYDQLTPYTGEGRTDRAWFETLVAERRRVCDILGRTPEPSLLPSAVWAELRWKDREKSQAEDAAKRLQGELDAARAAQSAAETQRQEVKDELERANTAAAQLREDLDQAKTKLARLATKYHAAVGDIEEIRAAEGARLEGLMNLVEAAKADRDKHQAQIDALEAQLAHTRRCLEEERAELDALKEANMQLKEGLDATINGAGASDRLLQEERAKTEALEEKRDELERRLSESNKELATTRQLLGEEEFKAAALRDSQQEYHRRLTDVCTERDRLLAQEKRRSSDVLQETTHRLEQRLQEVNAEAENLLNKERVKARVLADIRVQLKRRLSEVRADAAAEAQKRKRDMDALRTKHRAAIDEITRLQTELDEAKSRQSTLECDLFEARDTVKTLQSLNDQLTTNISTFQHYINSLQQKQDWRARLRSFLHLPEPSPSTPSLTPIGIPNPPPPNQPN